LQESEVFSVTGASTTPIPAEEESQPLGEIEDHTSRQWFPPRYRKIGGLVVILSLLIAGAVGYRAHHAKKAKRAQEVKEQISSLMKRRSSVPPRIAIPPQKPLPSPNPPPSQVRETPPPPKPALPSPSKASPTPTPVPPVLPIPDVGSLLVDSTPQGATIYLNDVNTNQKTPFTFDGLRPGTQRLGLSLNRYGYWQGEAAVIAGKTQQVTAALALNYGGLEINSLPTGATILLNEEPAGVTPFHKDGLEPDTVYQVTLQLPGFQTWKGAAKVFGGKNQVLNVSLKKLPKPLPD
jgi:hypothetical protein